MRAPKRAGIVLLEVLLAAALLGAVAGSLAALQERCWRREELSEAALSTAMAADRLLAEAELQGPAKLRPSRGYVRGLDSVYYVRFARERPAGSGLYEVRVVISYQVGGEWHEMRVSRRMLAHHVP